MFVWVLACICTTYGCVNMGVHSPRYLLGAQGNIRSRFFPFTIGSWDQISDHQVCAAKAFTCWVTGLALQFVLLMATLLQLRCNYSVVVFAFFFLPQGGKLARFPHVYWPSVFHLLRTLLISWEGSLVALFDFFFDLFRSMYIVDIICNIIRYYS